VSKKQPIDGITLSSEHAAVAYYAVKSIVDHLKGKGKTLLETDAELSKLFPKLVACEEAMRKEFFYDPQ
jgi:hypothetical protein